MLSEPFKNSSTLSFDSCSTDRKVVKDGLEFQIDLGFAQNNNSLMDLTAAHQYIARLGVRNKQIK